ncbi:Peptidase M20 domain-containing protein.2 [Ceratocystis lukuohia]|uniref:Peptidase M20 domain-containing protein.2 n=1 Tax=Ceratocystis lukuohia TaxID=2019550 RepID=A0ABR4MD02_9PEZI
MRLELSHMLLAGTPFVLAAIAQDAQLPLGVASSSDPSSSLDSTQHSQAWNENVPAYRTKLLDLHKSLVTISSTSRNESGVGAFLCSYLDSHGFTTQIQSVADAESAGAQEAGSLGTDVAPRRFNVLAWPSSVKKSTGRVLLTSHIDVVPPHIPYWISDKVPTGNTRIGGRGSVDAKGSVAAQVIAMQELLADDAIDPSEVALVYVVGEEINGDGMETFSDAINAGKLDFAAESAIFGEPTRGKLACGHKGGVFCSIHAYGKAGHSGYPWLGKSANEALVLALAQIATVDLGSSKKYGNTTVNIGRIDGGVAANVIPEKAVADIGIRVAIGPTETGGEIVKKRVVDILASIDDELELVCPSSSYGVVECECGVDGFDTTIENYGTDIPHLRVNQKNYLYGPGSIFVAHGDHENLTVSDLEEAVEGFKKLVLHALSDQVLDL